MMVFFFGFLVFPTHLGLQNSGNFGGPPPLLLSCRVSREAHVAFSRAMTLTFMDCMEEIGSILIMCIQKDKVGNVRPQKGPKWADVTLQAKYSYVQSNFLCL